MAFGPADSDGRATATICALVNVPSPARWSSGRSRAFDQFDAECRADSGMSLRPGSRTAAGKLPRTSTCVDADHGGRHGSTPRYAESLRHAELQIVQRQAAVIGHRPAGVHAAVDVDAARQADVEHDVEAVVDLASDCRSSSALARRRVVDWPNFAGLTS